ncbi:uncharacterized protein LOC121388325 isoform X2 [Gigantopelta aegis]|uniref:uncharacterized protein LOC121388325 isoform X2 n=1 Tax=Gigantopelta aegis TaxID=1735272 RepID=UPI001B88B918|nr:uncharacterized protein LOC121388325 isoform X2 [Gigantopelta aegis]
MESVQARIRKLSASHVCFVGLCVTIVYLFRAGDSYFLQPVWRKRVENQAYFNTLFPTDKDRLPSPVVTDLESDGINEVVLITPDLKLCILAIPDHVTSEKTLPHVVIKHRVRLPTRTIRDDKASRPVVMETGFTQPYLSMMQIRKQIIIIVMDDWQVLCYSYELKLLWQRKLMDKSQLKDAYEVKSMGALVTSHSVRKNDDGLIVIGGSMMHKVHTQQNDPNLAHRDSNETTTHSHHDVASDDDESEHFSTFALSGNNGTLRWHHLPGDFVQTTQDARENVREYHWKLSLKRNLLHKGESTWTVYKHNILQFMPHLWTSIADTKFTLARIQKLAQAMDVKPEVSTETSRSTSSVNALKPEHIVGYAYGGQRPHSHHEHVTNPNAVVIHNHNGIEVLNILSGRPMTRVALRSASSVYLDVDDDGELEHVTWGQYRDHTPCYLEIWRDSPIKEKLDQINVCVTKRLVWTRSWALDEDFHKKLPPYIIRSIARKTGLMHHLLGRHLFTDQGYDVISVSSLGRVSSFDLEGRLHWQAQIDSRWADVSVAVRRSKNLDSDRSREFFKSFQPSRVPMSVGVFGKKDTMVIAGYNAVSVVSLLDGQILAEHSIPTPPTGPLVTGDFNNDGITDVILTCKMGYIGFALKTRTNHTYTAMYAIAVLMLILLVTYCLSPDARAKDDD